MKTLLISALRLYRAWLAPFLGPCCRFEPSCSRYAEEAVSKKGAAFGMWISAKRLLKCHPFHPGGYDPVEE